ncbi:hypothetical protein LC087_11520 [Bacillus carboniphilus]|uniref:Lipase n=1 Tax=Bacillus carboniphilus TaxID=86663 RepID=A0ABY9JSP4_9BACI|nr:hypothetical protein [Bacillus carboniphilus]WLR41518.1 hypothetical protein LC087_11520 [Bacillus carboniphilus]
MDITNVKYVDNNTTHNDLVELAGYHAYRKYKMQTEISVNNTTFKVVDTRYNHKSGLDALTVRNVETNEITVVYVGTDTSQKADLITDAQLLSELTPSQIKEARKYYNEMDELFKGVGGVTSVTGNSLGGGLANAVAVEHPGLRTVTLNPALLPDGMIEEGKSYDDHITNYFSQYDVLTGSITSLWMGNRIPGKQYEIYNGIPDMSKIGTNHTGYRGGDIEKQYYTIGKKGQPGYGRIYIDADSSIVTSIWTGQPLYGGHSDRIDINKQSLDHLASSIEEQVRERLELANGYLGNSYEIVEDEESKYFQRLHDLQRAFDDLVDHWVEDPLFVGLSSPGNALKREIGKLIDWLDKAEQHCLSLNAILNSPPSELLEHVTRTNISVESIFSVPRNKLYDLQDKIDEFTKSLNTAISDEIQEILKGGAESWRDAVVGEIDEHYQIVHSNSEKLLTHIAEYKSQVQDVATAFTNRDQSLGNAIKSHVGMAEIDSVQSTNEYVLEDSPYMKVRMKLKEMHVEVSFQNFSAVATAIAIPLIVIAIDIATKIEGGLEIASGCCSRGEQR